MKRFALCAALVALMAAPLFADPTPIKLNDIPGVTIERTAVDMGDTGRDTPNNFPLYDHRYGNTAGWWTNTPPQTNTGLLGTALGMAQQVGEDMHLIDTPGQGLFSFTHLHYVVFGGPTSGSPFFPTSSYSAVIGFHQNVAPTAATPVLPGPTLGSFYTTHTTGSAVTTAFSSFYFLLSGLVGPTTQNTGGGWGWTITFTSPLPLMAQDIWMTLAATAVQHAGCGQYPHPSRDGCAAAAGRPDGRHHAPVRLHGFGV